MSAHYHPSSQDSSWNGAQPPPPPPPPPPPSPAPPPALPYYNAPPREDSYTESGFDAYTERSSLLGDAHAHAHAHAQRKPASNGKILVVVLLLFCSASAVLGYASNTLVNQRWHDNIVREVTRERAAWKKEVHEHEDVRVRMHQERREWDGERRRRQQEDVREEREREEGRRRWGEEEKRRADEKRSRQEKEAREEEKKAERKRRQQEEETRQEQEKERHRRDEEKRQRESIEWSGLRPSHCLRYGVREYTATLTNVPLGFNAIEECHNKPIEIHGWEWLASSCEDQGVCGRVTGHWKVDSSEGGCTPFWSYFKDKGCVEPGIRRHEAPLENLHSGDNWEDMCSTTPTNINGKDYDGPTSCVDWGKYGIWGIWLVNDNRCL